MANVVSDGVANVVSGGLANVVNGLANVVNGDTDPACFALHSSINGHAMNHVASLRQKLSEPASVQSDRNVLYTATTNAYTMTSTTSRSMNPHFILVFFSFCPRVSFFFPDAARGS